MRPGVWSVCRPDSAKRTVQGMRLSSVRSPARAAASVATTLLVASAALSATSELDPLLYGIEHRYNRAQTLSVKFQEEYSIAGRSRRPEAGELLLRKPGKMRWQYTNPPGKLFVSDGKEVYLYTAKDNRLEKSKLKASEDMRAPLAFLLGKLDFKKQFGGFEIRPSREGTFLIAKAGNERLPYEQIEMLVRSDFSIQRLTIDGRDQSKLKFTFENEVLNPTVNDGTFRFSIPRGAEVIDAVGAGSGEN
jgi:outer membrane lipoprotein carrier protein